MPSSGLSGQYGGMPQNIFREKYETTNLIEPLTAPDDYFRDTLKDLSCDKPFFESDQPREDNHSEEFLSVRHSGHRSGEVPDAPDLFLELTDMETRGTSVDPDFRLITQQSWERAGAYKFYSDSDNSITEREKTPQQLISQIRDQFENIKSRMKWFSTSKDNFAAGGNFKHSESSRGEQMDREPGMSTRPELSSRAKSNLTTLMSNNMPLGWEQTGDAEYKVASYGQVRSMNGAEDQELVRSNTVDDKHDMFTKFQDQQVTVGIASMMKTVVDGTSKRESNGEWLPGLSRDQTTSQFKRTGPATSAVDGFTGDQRNVTVFKTMENFIGQLNRQSGMANQDIESQLQVIQFMDSAARTAPKSVERIKATDVVLSAKSQEQFAAARVTGVRQTTKPGQRQSNGTAQLFESMQVARLGSARLTGVGNQLKIAGEGYKQTSHVAGNAVGHKPQTRNAYTAQDGQAHDTFGTKNRSGGALGSKFTRDKMDGERTLNAMSELN